MLGGVTGKVAARGQGRGHAVRLAREGPDVIAAGLAAQVDAACPRRPGAVARYAEKGRKP
jgi:hypothetical protein